MTVALATFVWLTAQAALPARALDVASFGARCDGVADDAPALQAALDASATGAKTIRFPTRRKCRLSRGVTAHGTVSLIGRDTTIVCELAGTCISGANVKLQIRGLTIDGAGTARTLLVLESSEFHIVAGVFRNAYSTISARAFVCIDCATGEIRDSRFENILALANGKEGDEAGAARAVFLTGSPRDVTISGNVFSHIHSVDSSRRPVMEDADAVHVYGDRDARVLIRANSFSDVGKRAVKLQCNGAVVRDNQIVSTWRDGAGVMFAGVGVFGSHNVVRGNKLLGASYQHGIELMATGATGNTVEANTITDSAEFASSGPYGRRSGILASLQNDLRIAENRVSGFYAGIMINGGSDILLARNTLTANVRGTSVEGPSADRVHIVGNVIAGRTPARSSENIGTYFGSTQTDFVVTGNSYRSLLDGIYIANPRSSVIAPESNSFADIGRATLFRAQ